MGRAGPGRRGGPTCDSDDAYSHEHGLVRVPGTLASGDPVWVLSCGAYATSYMTQGFNGFSPLPYTCIDGGDRGRRRGRPQEPAAGAACPGRRTADEQ